MVGINPRITTKLTFGAADVAPISQPIVASPISNNPIQERHGYIEQDLYGERSHNSDITQSPEYSHYLHQEHKHSPTSMLKTVVMIGLIGGGIALAISKRKAIGEFLGKAKDKVKNIFKKSDSKAADVPKSKKDIRPPAIVELASFNKDMEEIAQKADDGKFADIVPKDFRVLYGRKEKTATKQESLVQLYELAKIYSQKDRQARVLLMMPESMAEHAEHVVEMFSKNRIDEVDSKLIAKIEGFQIVNADRRSLNEGHDMIVDSQIRYGVNAGKAGDVGNKWVRNIKRALKEAF